MPHLELGSGLKKVSERDVSLGAGLFGRVLYATRSRVNQLAVPKHEQSGGH